MTHLASGVRNDSGGSFTGVITDPARQGIVSTLAGAFGAAGELLVPGGVADEYLTIVNRDRPEHLEAILAPSIVPAE